MRIALVVAGVAILLVLGLTRVPAAPSPTPTARVGPTAGAGEPVIGAPRSTLRPRLVPIDRATRTPTAAAPAGGAVGSGAGDSVMPAPGPVETPPVPVAPTSRPSGPAPGPQ